VITTDQVEVIIKRANGRREEERAVREFATALLVKLVAGDQPIKTEESNAAERLWKHYSHR